MAQAQYNLGNRSNMPVNSVDKQGEIHFHYGGTKTLKGLTTKDSKDHKG